jgi:AcrR family transcriptional regulator
MAPEKRREEILAVATELIFSQGFDAISVDLIVQTAAIAKGTFYYYFDSKKAVLEAIALRVVERMVEAAREISEQPGLNAAEKIGAILGAQKQIEQQAQSVVDGLHQPGNRLLHDRINIELIKAFGPVLAQVVEQGCAEKVFDVDDPLSTMQFILAGSQMLFGHDAFNWTAEELAARQQAMVTLVGRTLNATPVTMQAILQSIDKHAQRKNI